MTFQDIGVSSQIGELGLLKVSVEARSVGSDRLSLGPPPLALSSLLDQAVVGLTTSVIGQILSGRDRLIAESDRSPFGTRDHSDAIHQVISSRPIYEIIRNRGGELPIRLLETDGPILAALDFPSGAFGLLATGLSLEEGSLLAKFAGHFVGAGAGTAAILFLLSMPYQQFLDNSQWNAQIQRVVEGQACEATISAKLDINRLRSLSATALDLRGVSVDDPDHQFRVCVTQLLLRLNGAPPGEIDGILGKNTMLAKRQFAQSRELLPTQIDSPEFYELLVDGVQPSRK